MTGELVIDHLSLQFGGIIALDSVNLSVSAGEMFALVGPNGAGKSSLFNCIGGLYRPTSGRIVYQGKEVTTRKPYEIAALGIGRTFQNLAVIADISVMDNILLGGHLVHRPRTWSMGTILRLPYAQRAEGVLLDRAWSLLERFGLAEVAHKSCSSQPFGTLKRVELARALMGEPSLLLVDEPAGGLTQVEVFELGDLIRDICTELRVTALLVEHHMGLVARIADRAAVLNAGRVIAVGTPDNVLKDTAVVAAYLGSADE